MTVRKVCADAWKILLGGKRCYAILAGGSALLLIFLAGTKYLTKTFCEIFHANIFTYGDGKTAQEWIFSFSACALTDAICLLLCIPACAILVIAAARFVSPPETVGELQISVKRTYSCAWAILWRCMAATVMTGFVWTLCHQMLLFFQRSLDGLLPLAWIQLLSWTPAVLCTILAARELTFLLTLPYICIVFYDIPVRRAAALSRDITAAYRTKLFLLILRFLIPSALSYLSFGLLFCAVFFPLWLLVSSLYAAQLVRLHIQS